MDTWANRMGFDDSGYFYLSGFTIDESLSFPQKIKFLFRYSFFFGGGD